MRGWGGGGEGCVCDREDGGEREGDREEGERVRRGRKEGSFPCNTHY